MKLLSCCGTNCELCDFFGGMCRGCNKSQGKVFHAPEGRACDIYECVINQKKLKHCGQCENVPCSIWIKTRDPRYTDEEFIKSINNRINALNRKQ